MSKKLVILVMAAMLALVIVTPALAVGNRYGRGGAGGRGHQLFSVLGSIDAIGGDTITLVVIDGSWAVWAAGYEVGDELTVRLNDGTAFYRWTPDGRLPIDFEDLAEGDTTNIHGTVTGGVFTASRVTVDVECPH